MMRLYVIIIISGFLLLSTLAFAQKVTITGPAITLQKIFREIESQTGYQVFYSNQILDDSQTLSVNFKRVELKEVLEYCLRGQRLGYKIKERTILINTTAVGNVNAKLPMKIAGRVTNDKNRGLSGVTVTIKGSGIGGLTDESGAFIIHAEDNQKLLFSMVGYQTVEYTINGNDEISIKMTENIGQLEQVVVTGYGQKKISELTGAISSVQSRDLVNVVSASLFQNLKGKLAGINISNADGNPLSSVNMNVRGIGSLGGLTSNQVLVVIDGLIQDPRAYNTGSPNDIESVTLLKDAAATALYGSRAANGVLVITTKGSSYSKPVPAMISFEASFSLAKPGFGKFKLMNSQERYDLMRQAYSNDYRNNNPSADTSDLTTYLSSVMPDQQRALSHDTDWLRLLYTTGHQQRYIFTASGSSAHFNYYLGTTVHRETPIFTPQSLTQYNIRLNTTYKASSRLSIYANFSGSYHPNNTSIQSAYGNIYRLMPWDAPSDAQGNYRIGGPKEPGWYSGSTYNPLYTSQNKLNTVANNGYSVGADLKVSYNILPWLEFSSSNRYMISLIRSENYSDPSDLSSGNSGGSYSRLNAEGYNYITSDVLTFTERFGLHRIKGIAGMELNRIRQAITGGSTVGIISGVRSLTQGRFQGPVESISETAYLSYISELNYGYNERYYLSASFRRDGSSKFGANRRYGDFYSFGTAWTASNEDFLKGNSTITNLRLRFSYGKVGNADPVNAFDIYGRYQNVSASNGYDGKQGLIPGTADDNPDLHWEIQKMSNFGINIDFWKRLEFSVDFYHKENSNILRSVLAPLTSGVGSVIRNIGRTCNKGMELEITSKNVHKRLLSWNTSLNISFNRNRIKYLTDSRNIFPTTGGYINFPGYAIGTVYAAVYLGADPATGKPSYERVELNGTISTTTDVQQATMQIVGSQQPDYYGGVTNTLIYKNLTISVLANFVHGPLILNETRGGGISGTELDGASLTQSNAALPQGQRRWQMPGDIADVPAASIIGYAADQGSLSTRFIEDASFLRIRSIRMDYTFNGAKLNKMRIRSATLFLAVDNVAAITGFTGIDPESGGNNVENYLKYPFSRKWTCGLKINL
jgi:TonB-linked SusC/RagA family outer membrane protein